MDPISLVELARRLRVAPNAVRVGVSTGRLVESVVRRGRRFYVKPDLAMIEWERNRSQPRPDLPRSEVSMLDARRRLVNAQAERAELDRDRVAGLLVPLREVEARRVAEVIRARDHFQGIP